MCGEEATAPPTPMQVFLRSSTTTAFLCCPLRFDFRSSSHGTRRRPLPHPPRQGPGPWRCADKCAPDRRDAPTPSELPRRGSPGHPSRGRQPRPPGRNRKGKRPLQCAGPWRREGADAEGPERMEPGRERGAYTGATGGGEGSRREAQPAARGCPGTAVCRRQGSGCASALSRTGMA